MMRKTALVRERSRVQSSLAAPSFPNKNNALTDSVGDVSRRADAEQNAKTQKKLGETRVARSSAVPKKKNAVPADPRNGADNLAKASHFTGEEYNAVCVDANLAFADLRRLALQITALLPAGNDDAEAVLGLVDDLRDWMGESGQ